MIIGHSFGAYIGASYAMSFPSRVSHLILASPVGVPNEPDMPEPPRRQRISFGWRLVRNFVVFLWNRGYTPQSVVRLIGPIGPRPVTAYVTRRFLIGPAIEDTPPETQTTSEAGLETSAALVDQIDKGKLKLPKQDVAQYLVCDIRILSSIFNQVIYHFSTIYVLNLVVVNSLYLVFLNQLFLHIIH